MLFFVDLIVALYIPGVIFLLAGCLFFSSYRGELNLPVKIEKILCVISFLFLISSICLFSGIVIASVFMNDDYSQVKVESLQKFSLSKDELIVQTTSGKEYSLMPDDTAVYWDDGFFLRVNDKHLSNCFVPAREPIIVARFGALCLTVPLEANTVYVDQELYNQLLGIQEIPVSDWNGEQESSSSKEYWRRLAEKFN